MFVTLYHRVELMPKSVLGFLIFLSCLDSSSFAGTIRDTLRTNSLLYSGVEYTRGLILFGETPYYLGSEPFPGTIKYRGNYYNLSQLQYDCRNEVLITTDRKGDLAMELITEKIDEFTIAGHHFDKLKIQGNRGLFYERIYSGKYTLYVHWQKKVISNRVDEKRYVLFRNVFLMNKIGTIRINKAADYFNLLGENKNKIKRYYKEQHLNFRKEPIAAMESMLKKAEAEQW